MTVSVFAASGPIVVKPGDLMAFTHTQPSSGKPARIELVRADGTRIPLVSGLASQS